MGHVHQKLSLEDHTFRFFHSTAGGGFWQDIRTYPFLEFGSILAEYLLMPEPWNWLRIMVGRGLQLCYVRQGFMLPYKEPWVNTDEKVHPADRSEPERRLEFERFLADVSARLVALPTESMMKSGRFWKRFWNFSTSTTLICFNFCFRRNEIRMSPFIWFCPFFLPSLWLALCKTPESGGRHFPN